MGEFLCVILTEMRETHHPDLSLVVPVYNEAQNLLPLHREIVDSCSKLNNSYELIFVDDGSWDESFVVLKNIQKDNHKVKVIKLRKNFGQTAALSAGFDYAQGDIIISLDADLQNDPKDFPLLIQKIQEGYDIVSGWRQKRKDRLLTRRLPSFVGNWLISFFTRIKLHDYGCMLKAFRKEVVKSIRLYGEMHRFIPAIARNMGFLVTEVRVNHRPRLYGKSKYRSTRFIRVMLDLLTVKFLLSYSTRPLQIFGLIGFLTGIIGIILGLYLSYQRLIIKVGISGRPLLLLAILLIVTGLQFITLGLLAEIMVRAYHESVGKKIYIIQEIVDSELNQHS